MQFFLNKSWLIVWQMRYLFCISSDTLLISNYRSQCSDQDFSVRLMLIVLAGFCLRLSYRQVVTLAVLLGMCKGHCLLGLSVQGDWFVGKA